MQIDLINVPREITAVAEWLFMILIIFTNKNRMAKWKVAIIISFALPMQIIYLYATGNIPVEYWIPAMIGAVLIVYTVIYITCEMDVVSVVFHTAKAFVLAEFAASLEWQFYYFMVNVTGLKDTMIFEYGFSGFIFLLLFIVAYFIEFRYIKRRFLFKVSRKDMISIVSIVLMVFTISNLSFLQVQTPISGRYPEEIFYIRTLVNLCGIILIYMHREHHFAMHTKSELSALQHVYQSQYNRYTSSRDNLELINQRFHDLKHQISLMKVEKNSDKRQQYLSEIEKNIDTYGVLTNTGYHVLDTIITSKRMICVESDINFTCVIDGSLLTFMSIVDISSLFGNALDNAIESVEKIPNRDKRLIKVAVYKQQSLLMIKVENYYENNLIYDRGALTSTKENELIHGYGIKSIRSIAEKYNGNTTISTKDNWFILCVLIPLEQ